MKLNFSKYDDKETLLKICEDESLLSAHISLIITTFDRSDKIACKEILDSIFQTYNKAKFTNKTKNDIRQLMSLSDVQRNEIE
jgi:uncharacterized protein YjgD (DUF1641 family)